MKTTRLKVKNLNSNYSIIIGRNILNQISHQIKGLCPGAQKIALVLDKNIPPKFKVKIKSFILNSEGRCKNPILEKNDFIVAKYELIFFCGDYFNNIKNLSKPFFIDDVIIRFGINNDKEHYHVPLLVSPWSYSTYRGS